MSGGILYAEYLINKARGHWSAGNPLPTDLFMEMTNAGINVHREEREFNNQTEQ